MRNACIKHHYVDGDPLAIEQDRGSMAVIGLSDPGIENLVDISVFKDELFLILCQVHMPLILLLLFTGFNHLDAPLIKKPREWYQFSLTSRHSQDFPQRNRLLSLLILNGGQNQWLVTVVEYDSRGLN